MPRSSFTPAQLTASSVSVRSVFERVDITVTSTSRWGIVGENGRGKSNLLDVLAGTRLPDTGSVTRVGSIGFARQEMSADDDRTVGDVVADAIAEPLAALAELDAALAELDAACVTAVEPRYSAALDRVEALDAWNAERRVHIALQALGVGGSMGGGWASCRLSELSVGQRYRVRLACLLGASDDFLLLDEPTNHLDGGGLDFLTEQIRVRNGGVVVVSHDRALLADVAQSILDLDPTSDGAPRVHGGGYDGYRVGRIAERARWEQEYERQQLDVARLQDALRTAQNRLVDGWRPGKGAGKHQRATRASGVVHNVHRRREALENAVLPVPEPPHRLQFPPLESAGSLVVESVCVAGRLDSPVDVHVEAGSKLIVTGPNGSGKSTLLATMVGEIAPTSGSVRTYGGRVVLLEQESRLDSSCRVTDFPDVSSLGLLRSSEMGKRVGELSAGQRRRLDLAIALSHRPTILLLDEPTNHLSTALVDELTEALCATPAAVVVSTHDRQLLRDLRSWPRLELSGR
ncbi:ATP-binding cassette domain-containing protein [Rhodococcus sp. 14-2470-1a]|uniref:ATP-binding cassette domain-containing protein n=1 Tax=Rhodococcus sp. 14-2470-1a TaxID=2023150 RepID=UPI000B9B33F2|nr:ATP-binding cassette domain-containing protein [Rhodococcus sp. 14-2470-1a]OZF55449.1 ABC transporter [Rhodococcus sp. 14-2470-1a]